jgi:hypothetical protein
MQLNEAVGAPLCRSMVVGRPSYAILLSWHGQPFLIELWLWIVPKRPLYCKVLSQTGERFFNFYKLPH